MRRRFIRLDQVIHTTLWCGFRSYKANHINYDLSHLNVVAIDLILAYQ